LNGNDGEISRMNSRLNQAAHGWPTEREKQNLDGGGEGGEARRKGGGCGTNRRESSWGTDAISVLRGCNEATVCWSRDVCLRVGRGAREKKRVDTRQRS